MKRVLIACDNNELMTSTIQGVRCGSDVKISYVASVSGLCDLPVIDFGKPLDSGSEWDLILSLHCQQIFCADIVKRFRCVNLHPGLFPHGRGYYPYVFAVAEQLPLGVTLHEMDERIDHGPVIDSNQIPYECYWTCKQVYAAIRDLELRMLWKWFPDLVSGEYKTRQVAFSDGSRKFPVRTRKEYQELLEIDLQRRGTFKEFLNYMQAVTFGDQANAWFRSPDTGEQISVGIFFDAAGNNIYRK